MNKLEAKFDMLVKARESVDPKCNEDRYFHTFASLTRRVRPRCDCCGYFAAEAWFRRKLPSIDSGNPEMPHVVEAKEVTLCASCWESENIPEIFNKNSFEKVHFTDYLKEVNSGSKPNLNSTKFQRDRIHRSRDQEVDKFLQRATGSFLGIDRLEPTIQSLPK